MRALNLDTPRHIDAPRHTAIVRRLLPAIIGTLGFLSGCAESDQAQGVTLGPEGVLGLRIVNGQTASSSSDSTIRFVREGKLWCSGTLIAPNLVLTARHCVSNMDEQTNDPCGKFLDDVAPSSLGVTTGVNPSGIVAQGTKISHDGGPNMCGHDVTLVHLDRNVPGAKLSMPRFSNAKPGETGLAVGYGENGRGQTPSTRQERGNVAVLAVGPTNTSYKPTNAAAINYEVPAGDFATGESTCFGDSGGPIFDAQGQVFGVTSRGLDELCLDRPSLFASVSAHEALIRNALTLAGHPLPAPGTPAPAADAGAGNDPDAGVGETPGPKTTTTTTTVEEEDEEATTTTKRAPGVATRSSSSGCSAAPHSRAPQAPAESSGVAALGLMGLLAMARRRRRAEETRD